MKARFCATGRGTVRLAETDSAAFRVTHGSDAVSPGPKSSVSILLTCVASALEAIQCGRCPELLSYLHDTAAFEHAVQDGVMASHLILRLWQREQAMRMRRARGRDPAEPATLDILRYVKAVIYAACRQVRMNLHVVRARGEEGVRKFAGLQRSSCIGSTHVQPTLGRTGPR